LIETAEKYADGRTFETWRLPGSKRERNETPKEAASRLKNDVLKIGNLHIDFNFEKTDLYTEEKESESFPGLRSLYRMEIIEGHVTSADLSIRAEYNMDEEDGEFNAKLANGSVKTFAWLKEEQALDKQVKLRVEGVGLMSVPLLTPISAVKSHVTGTMHQRIAEVSKKVDAIYNRDKKLQELERNLGNLEVWTTTEPSQALSMLRQEKAKRKYVAQHEHYLRDFTRVLAEVQRLESCINPPGLQEIPTCNERLRRLETRSKLAVGAAVRLHDHVAQVAEEYHKTMVALNDQLLRWDTLVSG